MSICQNIKSTGFSTAQKEHLCTMTMQAVARQRNSLHIYIQQISMRSLGDFVKSMMPFSVIATISSMRQPYFPER